MQGCRVPGSMRTSGQLAMVPDGMVKFLRLGIGKAQPKAQPTHPDGASPEDMSCYCPECDNNGQRTQKSAGDRAEKLFHSRTFLYPPFGTPADHHPLVLCSCCPWASYPWATSYRALTNHRGYCSARQLHVAPGDPMISIKLVADDHPGTRALKF